jgi:hypothetical protein
MVAVTYPHESVHPNNGLYHKTNKYKMSLLDIVGVTATGATFLLAVDSSK